MAGVGPGWARQEASHHTGPLPEPNCLQKPWLTWSCWHLTSQAALGRGNRPHSAAAATTGESQPTATAFPSSLFTAVVFWPLQLPWQARVPSSCQHAEGICFCKSLRAGIVLGRLLPASQTAATWGSSPHVERAASHPSSLQKPGSKGRAALQSPDMQSEATEAHQEAEGGREKQVRTRAVHSLGGCHGEIWGEACKKQA